MEKHINDYLDCDCKNAHRNLEVDGNFTKLNCGVLWHNSVNLLIITALYIAMSEFFNIGKIV